MPEDSHLFQMIMKRFDSQDAKMDAIGADFGRRMDKIAKDQEEMKINMAKRNGFVSGAMFIGGLVWTGLTYFFSKPGGGS